jgi:hypothetical protein
MRALTWAIDHSARQCLLAILEHGTQWQIGKIKAGPEHCIAVGSAGMPA